MMTTSLASAKTHLSALVDEIVRTHEQITVTRNGEPAVVILAVEDLESMEETLALAVDFDARARIADARDEMARGEFVSRDDMAALMAARRDRDTDA